MKEDVFLIALIGFLMVFVVLFLICGAIEIMGAILGRLNKDQGSSKPNSSAQPQKAERSSSSPKTSQELTDESLLAVVTSALMEENGWRGDEFQVVSIKEESK